MRHLKTALTVLGAVTVLVLAGNTIVMAATGQSLLLGKSNSANNITAVTRTTEGTALKLQTAKAYNAPLAVNGTGKVANLNADKVDGHDSSALLNRSYVWTKSIGIGALSQTLVIPLPPGTYQVGYSAYLSGGGLADSAAGCYLRKETPAYTFYAEDRSATTTASPGFSGSAVITIADGDDLVLYCNAGSAWTTLGNEPIQIYATETTTVGGGSLKVAAKPAARGSR